MTTQGLTSALPAKGEIFELKLDGDAPQNDPMNMEDLPRGWMQKLRGWKFKGERVSGIQVRTFKLVSTDYYSSLWEAIPKLKPHGNIPGGQWREAFKQKYLYPHWPPGNWLIAVADPSWEDYVGGANYPCVCSLYYAPYKAHRSSFFKPAQFSCGAPYWFWLMEVSP